MSSLKLLYQSLFFAKWFYRISAAIIFVFILSYGIPVLYQVALFGLFIFIFFIALDFGILFIKRNPASLKRILPERMSNGDDNILQWQVENHYPFRVRFEMIDEFPEYWQIRDLNMPSPWNLAKGRN